MIIRVTGVEVEVGATENLGNYDNAKMFLRVAVDVDVALSHLPTVVQHLVDELRPQVGEYLDQALERADRPARHDTSSPRYNVIVTSQHRAWAGHGKVAAEPLAPAVAVVPSGQPLPNGWFTVSDSKGLRHGHAFRTAGQRIQRFYDETEGLKEVDFYDLTVSGDTSVLPVRGENTDAPAPQAPAEVPLEREEEDPKDWAEDDGDAKDDGE